MKIVRAEKDNISNLICLEVNFQSFMLNVTLSQLLSTTKKTICTFKVYIFLQIQKKINLYL